MTSPPTIECPKCGRAVPEAAECLACGVVFAKIRQAESHPVNSASQPTAPLLTVEEPGSGLRFGPVLAVLAVAAVGGLAAVDWIDSHTDEIDVPVAPVATMRPEPTPRTAGAAAPRPVAPAAAEPRRSTPKAPERAPRPEQKTRWVDPDSTWFEGAAGFERALERARTKNQAMLVYFYTDWCGYCRELESELLSRAVVEEYTKYLVKIRVNPDKGASAKALARSYGVEGYPSLFVHPAGPGRAKKIRGMTRKGGEWRVLSPAAYVENLVAAAGERFGAS